MADVLYEEEITPVSAAPQVKHAPLFEEEIAEPGSPAAISKPPQEKLSDGEKLLSTTIAAGSRIAAIPGDLFATIPNIPAAALRGMGWLGKKGTDLTGIDSAETRAKEDNLRELANSLTPVQFNQFARTMTSEGGLEHLKAKGWYSPYEADTGTGAVIKAIAERGPSYFLSGAALKAPQFLNALTAVTSPAAGELVYQGVLNKGKTNQESADEARTVAELSTAVVSPLAQVGKKAISKGIAQRTRMGISELHAPDPSKIPQGWAPGDAMPKTWTSGEKKFMGALDPAGQKMTKELLPETRTNILASVENPTAGESALASIKRRIRDRITGNQTTLGQQSAARQSAAEQSHTGNVQQLNADQMARELAAQQAEQQSQQAAQKLQSTPPPEEIGNALHGEVVGAKNAAQAKVENAYGAAAGAENESVPLALRANVRTAIDDILGEGAARTDLTILPKDFLNMQLGQRIVGMTDAGLEYLRKMPVKSLVQLRREIDDLTSSQAFTVGDTAGNLRSKDLLKLRGAVNDQLDAMAQVNPKVAALRAADAEHSAFVQNYNKGIAKGVTSEGEKFGPTGEAFKKAPATTAEQYITKGTAGENGAIQLKRLFDEQQRLGVQSNLPDLTIQQLRSVMKEVAAKDGAAAALGKLTSDKGHGPFIRTFDKQFGTDHFNTLKNELQAQQIAEDAAKQMRGAADVGATETTTGIASSQAARDAEMARVAQVSADRERTMLGSGASKFANAPAASEMLRDMLRDPSRVREVAALVRRSGGAPEMYEGIIGAARSELNDMVAGKVGFGAAGQDAQAMVNRYSNALRQAGAPQEMIDNLRKTVTDIQKNLEAGTFDSGMNASTRQGRQLAQGLAGRIGSVVDTGLTELLGMKDVGAQVQQAMLTDPTVARYVLAYKGKNPDHFRKYLMKNAAIATLMNTEVDKPLK